MINKPNLFIVGAAKSGTTTLWSYLKKHSKIFMPEDMLYKEPSFFSIRKNGMNIIQYLDIFKDVSNNCIYRGEASTAYLTDEQSAKKIFAFNPCSKIIILLRNPIDRAYSLYNWMVQEGYEYANSFETALKLEQKRRNKRIPNFWEPEYYWNYMYLASGLYYEQVRRYIKLFGQNVKIVIFEEMTNNDINKTFSEICDFLDIEYEKYEIFNKNKSKTVISPALSFIVRKINNILYYKLTKLFMNKPTKERRDFFIKLVQRNKKPKKISKNLRRKLLLNYFIEDIKKLEILINKDLSIWKKI